MPKRVLLVEDSPDDRLLMERALRRHCPDIQVDFAPHGEAAVALLADGDRRPQLLLLDLQLPGMSGFDLLCHLRQSAATRTLPVVVLTGSDETGDIHRAYACGANSYLRKPVDHEALTELLTVVERYWLELNQVAS